MSDAHHLTLLRDPRPLRVLFLDLNAYFASVQQQENPEYRGRPIAVVPVVTDTSFVIAASYEAKAFGIKTGMRIDEAKRRCPDLILHTGGHTLYTQYHQLVKAAVATVLPIERVASIDEMQCRLLGEEQQPEEAIKMAKRVKQAIADHVGPYLKCSIGIAPNGFLAKIGTELQKPDGLVVIEREAIQEKLSKLELTDLPGINRRMKARLNSASLFTVTDLLNRDRTDLRTAFGSVTGERWWYLLRGYELPEIHMAKGKSLGHSHVLAPHLRTEEGARQVMLRLLEKASARLRNEEVCAGWMQVGVRGLDRSWAGHEILDPTQDSAELTRVACRLWAKQNFVKPFMVYVTFTELRPVNQVTPSLFSVKDDTAALSHALDEINGKFGKHSVFLAGVDRARRSAPERIAFAKTKLFSEGKGDHGLADTFRGIPLNADDPVFDTPGAWEYESDWDAEIGGTD